MNKKEHFSKAVAAVVEAGKFKQNLPRATFIKAIIEFRKTRAGILYLKNSPITDLNEWEDLFLQIVSEMGLSIQPGVIGTKKSMVTPAMRKGARSHQRFHEVRLGNDY